MGSSQFTERPPWGAVNCLQSQHPPLLVIVIIVILVMIIIMVLVLLGNRASVTAISNTR